MSEFRELQDLVGHEANAVCFVMDYVEIRFNGPLIRCVANPEVRMGTESFRFPDPGSRDALCSLIGRELTRVVENADISLEFSFGNMIRLVVPLDEESRFTGEAAHFVPGPNQPISVW